HPASAFTPLGFAYLGAGLPVLVLLAVQVHRLDLAVTDEHIAVEVVRTVVGAIGVLSAVPLTTAIAAWLAGPVGAARPSIPRFAMARPLLEASGTAEVALAGAGVVGSEPLVGGAAVASVGLPAPELPSEVQAE